MGRHRLGAQLLTTHCYTEGIRRAALRVRAYVRASACSRPVDRTAPRSDGPPAATRDARGVPRRPE